MNALGKWIRKTRWKARYRSIVQEVGTHPFPRVKVHAERIEDYFFRWLGFCRLPDTTEGWLIDNELFFVADAASTVAEHDILRLTDPRHEAIRRAWQEYQEELAHLRTCPQDFKLDAERTYEKLKLFADVVKRSSEIG